MRKTAYAKAATASAAPASDIARRGAYENEMTESMKYLTFFASVHRDSPSARSTRSYGASAAAKPLQRRSPGRDVWTSRLSRRKSIAGRETRKQSKPPA